MLQCVRTAIYFRITEKQKQKDSSDCVYCVYVLRMQHMSGFFLNRKMNGVSIDFIDVKQHIAIPFFASTKKK